MAKIEGLWAKVEGYDELGTKLLILGNDVVHGGHSSREAP